MSTNQQLVQQGLRAVSQFVAEGNLIEASSRLIGLAGGAAKGDGPLTAQVIGAALDLVPQVPKDSPAGEAFHPAAGRLHHAIKLGVASAGNAPEVKDVLVQKGPQAVAGIKDPWFGGRYIDLIAGAAGIDPQRDIVCREFCRIGGYAPLWVPTDVQFGPQPSPASTVVGVLPLQDEIKRPLAPEGSSARAQELRVLNTAFQNLSRVSQLPTFGEWLGKSRPASAASVSPA